MFLWQHYTFFVFFFHSSYKIKVFWPVSQMKMKFRYWFFLGHLNFLWTIFYFFHLLDLIWVFTIFYRIYCYIDPSLFLIFYSSKFHPPPPPHNRHRLIGLIGYWCWQVWDLEHRQIASTLQWESNITSFSVIYGTPYMYDTLWFMLHHVTLILAANTVEILTLGTFVHCHSVQVYRMWVWDGVCAKVWCWRQKNYTITI